MDADSLCMHRDADDGHQGTAGNASRGCVSSFAALACRKRVAGLLLMYCAVGADLLDRPQAKLEVTRIMMMTIVVVMMQKTMKAVVSSSTPYYRHRRNARPQARYHRQQQQQQHQASDTPFYLHSRTMPTNAPLALSSLLQPLYQAIPCARATFTHHHPWKT